MPNDPRAENCRAFHVDANGKVDGVELVVEPHYGCQYELVRVELIGEEAAKGQTVATCVVLDANGVQTAESVLLAWPWPELGNSSGMGNQNGQHMITNGYEPPNVGPLALYVADSAGNVISDIVGGLGLPYNRHVSYRATWKEHSFTPPPDSDDDDPTPTGDMAQVLERLARIEMKLDALSAHLGL